MANAEKLREVMDVIRQNPGRWVQCSFAHGQVNPEVTNYQECGTTFCFAGWTCILDGLRPAYHPTDFFAVGDFIKPESGECVDPDWYARGVLDLTELESEYLFYFFTHDVDLMNNRVEAVIAGKV